MAKYIKVSRPKQKHTTLEFHELKNEIMLFVKLLNIKLSLLTSNYQ